MPTAISIASSPVATRPSSRNNTVTLPGRWIQLLPGRGQRFWQARRVEVPTSVEPGR